MLPLPTNARSFFIALLRWEGVEEEEIAEQVEYLSKNEEDAQYLMLQGGSAGVAQLEVDDSKSITITFGECEDVVAICEIATEVYDFSYIERSLLC